jgi:hypothetical protein
MAAAAGGTNVVVWDFSGYWAATTEAVPAAGDTSTRMTYYFESSHYTPALGQRMLDRMFLQDTNEFGARIWAGNVETHLQAIQQQRERYAREHPSEVQWVQKISRQALAARKKNPAPDDDVE